MEWLLLAAVGYFIYKGVTSAAPEAEKPPGAAPIVQDGAPSGSGETVSSPSTSSVAPVYIPPEPPVEMPVVTDNLIQSDPSILYQEAGSAADSGNTVADTYGATAAQTIPAYKASDVEKGYAPYDPVALAEYVLDGVFDPTVLDHFYQWQSYWWTRKMTPGDKYFKQSTSDRFYGDIEAMKAWLHDVLFGGYRADFQFWIAER